MMKEGRRDGVRVEPPLSLRFYHLAYTVHESHWRKISVWIPTLPDGRSVNCRHVNSNGNLWPWRVAGVLY